MVGETAVSLAALLRRLPDAKISGPDRPINGIETDSRSVGRGNLFVALRGSRTDGHRFVGDAITRGASAVVVETDFASMDSGATLVRVGDTRRALSGLAAAFYGDPSAALDVIGVTGTNGKTTTCHMIAAILNEAGVGCGIIGTVGAEFRDRKWQLENTTPLPPELQGLLATMRDDGAKAIAMEVSSHALALERVEDVKFRTAVLTNVTRDHLDFHQTLESYAAAKRRLFDLAPVCVLNIEDEFGWRWGVELYRQGKDVISYGDRYGSLYVATDVVATESGSRFSVEWGEAGPESWHTQQYELHLPGRFNILNALAAIAATENLGIATPSIAEGLASLKRVAGRMERVHGDGIDVVVDYAHTPDALDNVLRALRETAKGGLSVVFGCGGNRDAGKRSEMGAVAAQLADSVYVTSDNPRSEDPQAIAGAIVAGIGSHEHVVELDRGKAIELAIAQAKPGDVVLIAGKGHENYQIVGDRVLPFDDVEVAREALRMRAQS